MASPSEKPDLAALKIDRSRGKYQQAGSSRWSYLGLLALLAVVIYLGMGVGGDLKVGPPGLPEVRVRTLAFPPSAASLVKGMAANGHVVAARRAALSADTPGRIVEMNVTEGSKVKQGEVVARLYSDEYAAALERARAEEQAAEADRKLALIGVDAAGAEIARLEAVKTTTSAEVRAREAELRLAGQERARVESLVKKGAAVTRELDQARSALKTAEARLDSGKSAAREARAALEHGKVLLARAKAQVALAGARLEQARASAAQAAATLEKTEVRAPFTGIVVLKDAEVGEVVSPNVTGGTSSRGAIVTMVDPASLEVQAEVPETSLKAVRVDGAVRIFLDADPDRAYQGKVARIWPTANRQKATVEVRVKFLEPDDRLRPDMGVRAVFLPEGAAPGAEAPPPPKPVVPERSLVSRDGRKGVFVFSDDRVRFRGLELGEADRGEVEVESGIEPGVRFVLDPPEGLRDGDRVRVKED